MDALRAMSIFVAVVDSQGFAPAARRLAISPPAVTRAIAGLEQRIGTRLLRRTTRRLRLTETGSRYLEDCRRILAEIAEAEETAAGLHREPSGQLGVTASVQFGHLHIAPIVLDFLQRFPKVSVRTLFVDRIANLVEEGLDVGIRIAQLPDSGMTALRVGAVRRVVCASPAYLAARGIPQRPEDLAEHGTVAFRGISPVDEWSFHDGDATVGVRISPRLVANTAQIAIKAAVEGHGLTRVLSYMIAPELAAGSLSIVLAQFEAAPTPVQIVHREGRQAAARVRAFVDFAARRLRADTAFN
jgi:DNA-binding transcriptional LysR family regulator